MSVVGIVLAAGAGTRYGHPKALATDADGAAAEVVSEQGLALFLGVSVSTLRG